MRKAIKVVLICALLSWGALGLRQAEGGRRAAAGQTPAVPHASADSRPHKEISVHGAHGSFVLKNLVLVGTDASTILKGKIVNQTERECGEVSFEVRAYGRGNQLLRGLEGETVFAVQGIKAKASAPLNDGYGVWLQGIPLADIARIEINEIGEEIGASTIEQMIPLAGHALSWKRYAEIEE